MVTDCNCGLLGMVGMAVGECLADAVSDADTVVGGFQSADAPASSLSC